MAIATRKGVHLHWQEQGAGPPVLLIMGHRFSSALWYPVIPALAAHHRVIGFDNRGTGESDTTARVTVQDLAADALAVLDAAGAPRAHIYGVSMGGVVALELALQAPDRALSLILGCTGVLTADKPRLPAALRALYYLPTWALRLILPNPGPQKGYGSAASAEAIAHDQAMIRKDRSNTRGLIAQAAAIAGYSTTRDAIAALPHPALVLHGDEDTVVPFPWGQELADTLAHSRFVRLEGAGHNFFVARRDEANRAVVGFLAEVEGGG